MEIILKQDVDKIGKIGQVVKVKDGFARNFLIPNKLAIPATAVNLKMLQQEKQRMDSGLEKLKKKAQELKEKLTGLSLTIPVLSQGDTLYGSITTQDIAAALKEDGFDVNKDSIILDEPIKALGIYEILVTLHPEVSTKIKIWAVKK